MKVIKFVIFGILMKGGVFEEKKIHLIAQELRANFAILFEKEKGEV
jgi:hypothetical protein